MTYRNDLHSLAEPESISTGTTGRTPGMFTGLERATPRAALVSTSTVSASDRDELDLQKSINIQGEIVLVLRGNCS